MDFESWGLVGNIMEQTALRAKWIEENGQGREFYSDGYRVPTIEDQAMKISEIFGVDFSGFPVALSELPCGAENNFVILDWHAVADNYSEAVGIAIEALVRKYSLRYKYFDFSEKALMRKPETENCIRKIAQRQGGKDFLVIPAQSGIRNIGRHPGERRPLFPGEFDLSTWEAACMLIATEGRFALPKILGQCLDLLCAGDLSSGSEFDPESGKFTPQAPVYTPRFFLGRKQIELGAQFSGASHTYQGFATGWAMG